MSSVMGRRKGARQWRGRREGRNTLFNGEKKMQNREKREVKHPDKTGRHFGALQKFLHHLISKILKLD